MLHRLHGGRAAAALAVLAALMFVPATAEAQFGGIGKKIQQKAKQRIEQKENDAAEKVVDAADPANAAAGNAAGTGAAAGADASAELAPGEGAWANYDFVPGTVPLFVEDYAKGAVGDFPRRLKFVEGNMEVAEWRGARWLRATSWPSKFAIALDQPLPERFTLEFDVTPGRANAYVTISFADPNKHSVVRFREISGNAEGGIDGNGPKALSRTPVKTGEPFRARIMADGKYVKVYANDTRVANVPTADLGRTKEILFDLPGMPTDPAFVGNISLMAGGRDLYDALSAEGRVATQGIYFDTGSDRIRPESTPTLKQIAAMLEEHGELKLTIEGHTDNVGNAAANQTLSGKRAEAVKAYLVGSGVDGGRLETAGLGDSKPSAPNATPEGRQQNRRVELVKN